MEGVLAGGGKIKPKFDNILLIKYYLFLTKVNSG